ncbi:MAG: GatB/YqeY domain-containing protein [Candidatus Omnitrophica bacterium]|nr:GatB/YqeY domain-containing protein [Candidatus Omnitrophota bacterium]MDD5355336.1 GatB/YqeY domain-containing protein [Candidatus Omnitrophota bacterium]
MLEDKIFEDFKDAMKKKDALRVSTLSFLRSQLKNVAIDKKKDKLEDSDVITVIKKQIKQRLDSIDNFKAGNRLDLADKEQGELNILKAYLPEELSKEELEKIINEAISSVSAAGMKDMGKVMKEVSSKTAGRADNKLVSDLVRAKLAKSENSSPESK